MDIKNLSKQPIKLKYTRIHRKYSGGLLMEQWQNNKNAADGYRPEEWIASTIEARTTDYIPNEGLSEADLPGISGIFLRDLINADPEAFLGKEHVKRYGKDTALLVKVIDSCNRLYLQVHPDREYAKKIFDSDFGKTEAWYILGGREINGQKPYILLGFKKGITKEVWKNLFEKQDIKGMENALHRFEIKPGDVYFIESGMPHALGTGCFLLEVQEPTDYTMRVERSTPEGKPLPDTFCHQGAGFEKMLECFHYEPYTREELLEKWYLKPSSIEKQSGGTKISIISSDFTPYFSMQKLEVTGTFKDNNEAAFKVAVVLSGHGKLQWKGDMIDIKQADELFLPAGLNEITWVSDTDEAMVIVFCCPPTK